MTPPAAAPPPMRMRLRLPPAYDLAEVIAFLAVRAVPAIEQAGAGGLVRAVRLGGLPATLTVRPLGAAAAPAQLAIEVVVSASPAISTDLAAPVAPATAAGSTPSADPTGPASATLAAAARRLVRRMLDLDTDLAPFHALAAADPLLAPLVARRPGLRLPQLPDPFEATVRAIVGQQVSVAGARTVLDRLIRRFGEPAPGDHGLLAFPAASTLAAAPVAQVAAAGLTRAKAAALVTLAAACRDGLLDIQALHSLPAEDAHIALVAQPGIGPWTASYVLMRALGDRDAFPAADLGLLKAMERSGSGGAGRPKPAAVEAHAERWRPWRAYAALHLWRSLDD